MPKPRHPVSVRGAALVQTERLQTYAFSVCWSDGSDTLVHRSWNEFKQLKKSLKEIFPVEAGLLRRSDRVLPKLADAPLLARGGRTGRGLVRLRLLETYIRALLAAEERVSQSPALVGFFAPQPLDLEPTLPPGSLVILPAPEEPVLPRSASQLAIRSLEVQRLPCLQPFHTQDTRGRPFQTQAHESLDVLLRHPSGWWLVANEDQQTAWFPAPYLEEVAPSQGQEGHLLLENSGSRFFSTCAYEGGRVDELSVPAGARVCVLEKSDRGWWLCRYGGQTGLLPAVLLKEEALGMLLSGPTLHGGEAATGALGSQEYSKACVIPPAVPARPTPSAIQSRCCTITRRALGCHPGRQARQECGAV